MIIKTLMENTTKSDYLQAEHGLSLYIETQGKKILFDTGESGLFAKNAKQMGVDLSEVDYGILSHGHYDHGGGIATFFEANANAVMYMNKAAFGNYYSGTEKYIGLDKSLSSNNRIKIVEDSLQLDKGIFISSCNDQTKVTEIDSCGLYKERNGQFLPDDFLHEQYLCIEENGKKILFSGCSHKGVLNIMSWFTPDVFIGGFHLMDKDIIEDKALLEDIAQELKKYPTKYYTCHCTGVEQYDFLKACMGDALTYLHTGSVIEV